jgi:DEAD/DEAH box helicase domain-containing protein
MPQRQAVLDLETQKIFDEIGSRNPADLGVSVVGVYFYENDEYVCYEESRIGDLEQRLSGVSRIIGFNIRRFDFPALQPYLKHIDLGQVELLDILEEIEKVLGHRVSLQSVASATLGVGKSGSGLDAIHYYRSGEIEKLKKYCLDDVRLTKDVYEYGKRNGIIHYLSKDGLNRLTTKVTWKDPAPPANLSLF